MRSLTGISLFSGAVDGLAIAAQAAGIKVTHHVEWDSWCCRVLRMNHPDSTVMNADIKTVKGLPYADIIMGGSPCQDFSGAGNQAGFAGKRYLWPEMRRIVGECRPRVVIHENVRGGISLGLLDRICSDMESDGYQVWPLVYPAAIFGAPHERYRMFHVGLLADSKFYRQPRETAKFDASSNLNGDNTPPIRGRLTEFHETKSGGQDVAYTEGHNDKRIGGTMADSQSVTGQQNDGNVIGGSAQNVEYANIKRLETNDDESSGDRSKQHHLRPDSHWNNNGSSQSELGRIADGSTSRIHRLDAVKDFPGWPAGQGVYQYPYEPPRTTPEKSEYAKERIQALGNAVVWQQAAPIFRAVVRWLESQPNRLPAAP